MPKPTQFIVNEKGERVAAIISIERYNKILEELEDLKDIRAYDEAKASKEPAIPLQEVLDEVRRERK